MKRFTIIALVLLCAGLAISLCLNAHLLHHAKTFYTQLQEVRLDPMGSKTYGGAAAPTSENSLMVVFVGDSRAAAWPPLDNSNAYTFVNRGVGNQTTAQILGRLQTDVLSLNPDIVVLQAGVNDLKTIPLFPRRKDSIILNCKSNLQSIVSQCAERNIKVIVSSIFPVGKPSLQRRPFWSADVARSIQEVNTSLQSLATGNVVSLDAHNALCGDNGLIRSEYSKDTLHMNDAGYHLINRELTTVLQEIRGEAQQ